jgi:hypothetical protein
VAARRPQLPDLALWIPSEGQHGNGTSISTAW